MYSVNEDSEEFQRLLAISKSSLRSLLQDIGVPSEAILCKASKDFFAEKENQGFIYRITEGNLGWCRNSNIIFMLEPDDYFGVEEGWDIQVGTYETQFAIRCERYAVSQIIDRVQSDLSFAVRWNSFLSALIQARTSLLFTALKGEKTFEPEIKMYKKDSVILTQGSSGDTVCTLMSGHAKVMVGTVTVGEVLADEIFGALASLTGLPRTASVIATEDCVVLSITKDKFLELIHARPATILKMVQDMARTIADLNTKVVSLSSESPHLFR